MYNNILVFQALITSQLHICAYLAQFSLEFGLSFRVKYFVENLNLVPFHMDLIILSDLLWRKPFILIS